MCGGLERPSHEGVEGKPGLCWRPKDAEMAVLAYLPRRAAESTACRELEVQNWEFAFDHDLLQYFLIMYSFFLPLEC